MTFLQLTNYVSVRLQEIWLLAQLTYTELQLKSPTEAVDNCLSHDAQCQLAIHVYRNVNELQVKILTFFDNDFDNDYTRLTIASSIKVHSFVDQRGAKKHFSIGQRG